MTTILRASMALLIAFALVASSRAQKQPDVRLDIGSAPAPAASDNAAVSASGSSVYAVWQDDRNGSNDIYFNRSLNGGTTWGAADVRLDVGSTAGVATSWYPDIASSGSLVCVAWQDYRNGSGADIYFNRSLDGGATWLAADVRLDLGSAPAAGASYYPRVAIAGSAVYVAWTDERSAPNKGDIYFNRSLDAGATWLATDIRLDVGSAPGAAQSGYPWIAASGSSVYVAWEDLRNSTGFTPAYDIYLNRSSDGGATWLAADVRLDTGSAPGVASSRNVQIAVVGSAAYVVWDDNRNGHNDIYLNRSTNGGASWLAADVRLDVGSLPGVGYSFLPQIAAAGNSIYVSWQDSRDGYADIYFNRSLDAGATWLATDTRVDVGDAPGASFSFVPTMAAVGAEVYVTWYDSRGGSYDVYANRSLDAGASWLVAATRVDSAPGTASAFDPRIAATGSSVCVVWRDYRNGNAGDIYSNRSTDAGASWGLSDIRLDVGSGPPVAESHVPQIAASGASIYVTWEDYRNGGVNGDIYFNRSLDGGATWSSSDVRLDVGSAAGSADSRAPTIACDGVYVYVAWQDARNGSLDVYVNRSKDGGATWFGADERLDVGSPAGHATSRAPCIATFDGSVYVSWEDARNGAFDIYVNRSQDHGESWLASDVRLDVGNPPGSADSTDARVAVDGQTVCVAWQDRVSGLADIYANRSIDGGASWLAKAVRVDTGSAPGAAESLLPRIAIAGSAVYVTWQDFRDNGYDVYANASSNGGTDWMPVDVRLDTSSAPGAADSVRPEIEAAGSAVYATWFDYRDGAADIYFNRSLDAGATWLPSEARLDVGSAPGAALSIFPSIAAAGATVCVGWREFRNGQADIYVNRSLDGGASWIPTDVRLDVGSTPGSSDSSFPQLAASGASIYATWVDWRNGIPDIYFDLALGHQPYGAGAPGSGGIVPSIAGSGNASIGGLMSIDVASGLGGALGALIYAFQGPAALPFGGGTLLVQPPGFINYLFFNGAVGTPGAGAASRVFAIPYDALLLGLRVNFQAAIVDAGAVGGIALSRGLESWIL